MMMILMIILTFFAVIGITQFILSLVDLFLNAGRQSDFVLVVPHLSGDSAEMRLRSALAGRRGLCVRRVVVIAENADDEAQAIAARLKGDHPAIAVESKFDFIKSL